jgi:selenocysteine lyase/cysteine desulfurase
MKLLRNNKKQQITTKDRILNFSFMTNQSSTTYLNTAACGLLEDNVKQAGFELYNAIAQKGSTAAEHWKNEREAVIRGNIARFINAPAENVAMVPNFSWALNGLVQSLKGTERVLLYKQDYPSVLESFRINGFPIHWIDTADGFTLPIDEINTAVAQGLVDMVVLSHVQYTSGYTLDIHGIGALCKANDVLFVVDTTQSIGAIPIDLSVLHADVLIASNYKWMNAAFGTGILYMSDSFLQKYPPVVAGNNSYRMIDGKMQYIPGAQSYEPGHPNMFGLTILDAAIKHKLEMGVDKIMAHNNRLTRLLLDNIKHLSSILLGPLTMDNRCSIVIMRDEKGLSKTITDAGIVVTIRGGLVRISMHYYNTEADVQRLIDVLESMK